MKPIIFGNMPLIHSEQQRSMLNEQTAKDAQGPHVSIAGGYFAPKKRPDHYYATKPEPAKQRIQVSGGMSITRLNGRTLISTQ